MTTAALRGGFFFEESEMFKRLTFAVVALFALAGQALASGTIPFSLSQQFDQYGKPLAGCLFYTIQAGTTSTPQNAYQDSALTIALPNPQTCDAAGRLPQMFLADGTIKVRLTDKNGVTQVVADNIQVIGASSGSGGGGTVDPTTILATGDIKVTYGTGSLSGFVRANGRTIGSSTSGATERANSDVQALFEYLWGADSNLAVSGGRGASAAADWAANKTIALPDFRGRAIAGLDDMGNSAAGILTGTYFGVTPTVLGASGGSQNHTIAQTNLPNINLSSSGLSASTSLSNNDNIHRGSSPGGSISGTGGTNIYRAADIALSTITATTAISGAIPLGGSGTSLATVSPMTLVTIYLKL
jgi:hypothetical protein